MGLVNLLKRATNTDLNNDGKVSGWERFAGIDPLIRGGAAAINGISGVHPRTYARNTYSPMQNGWSGEGQGTSWSPMKRQEFGMTQNPWQVNDFTNNFGNMGNTGLSGGYGKTEPWANPYKRQDFGLSAPQMPAQPKDMFDPNGLTQFTNTGLPMGNQPRITPNKMPVRNDLDFMNTAGSGYQSRYAPAYANPMTQNNGYFDMNKAGTAGGNWVQGAGWRTDANKAMGQTEEDMRFNAQMAQRIGNMAQ